MKLLHISDLHIGKQLHGYSLSEDQKYVLSQVLEAMKKEKPDALLIAGDIYDKVVPGAEAVKLFDWFLTEASEITPRIPIFMIAGNHDSARRIDYAGNILSREQIYIAGTPPEKKDEYIKKVILEDDFGKVNLYLLPFFKPGNIRGLFSEEENIDYVNLAKETGTSEYDVYFEKLMEREKINFNERNIMLTHQFFVPRTGKDVSEEELGIERTESEVKTVGMLDHISAKHLAGFDYVALGHIHRAQKCGRESVRYCGTLMPYSLSEEKDVKSITVVTLEEAGREPVIKTIEVKPLRKVRKLTGTKEELLRAAGDSGPVEDYVTLIVTDEEPGRYVREELGSRYSRILEVRFENSRMKELVGSGEVPAFTENYFDMFSRFYMMKNGCEMSEEECRIIEELLGENTEREEEEE